MSKITVIKQNGFTMIELMIAMLLGIFITGGMIQLFVSSSQTYRVQENLARVQENGRFSMGFISQSIRSADYWGCIDGTTAENNLKNGDGLKSFAVGVSGSNDDNTAGNIIVDGTDTITLQGTKVSGIFVTAPPVGADESSPINVTNTLGLKKDDIVIVADCAAADMFQITNDLTVNQTQLAHAKATGTPVIGDPDYPGNADENLEKVYGTDAQVYTVKSEYYSIQQGEGGQPALFRTVNGGSSIELVEGIEDMQILYGEDTDGDGTANYYVPITAIAKADLANIVSVKVSLVVVSLEDNLATQARPYTVFGVITPGTDRRIRRIFTSMIAIRSRLP